MRNRFKWIGFLLAFLVSFAVVFICVQNSRDTREKSIQTLIELRATVEFYRDQDGKPVVESVQFNQPLGIGKNGEGLQCLQAFPELVELKIINCDQQIDPYLVHIRRMTILNSLFLDSSNIHDSGLETLKNLTQIEELTLNRTKISDAGMQALSRMKNLKRLNLADNNLTSKGLAHLENLTVMSHLSLPRSMDDDACYYLRKMIFLETLSLPCAKLTRLGTQHLSQMNRLETLVLKDSEVDDEALRSLAQFKSLTSLDLSGTKITDDGIWFLSQVQTLEDLRLDGTGVTGQSVNVLGQFKNLRVLYARNTNLSLMDFEELERRIPGIKIYSK